MEQEKLEEKVRELFREQGFNLEKTGNRFTASQKDMEFQLAVFSSEKFSKEEVKDSVEEGEKVFVDEALSSLKEEMENQVSVLKEDEEERDLEVPSYERIGDIVVVNELDDLSEDEAVEAILEHNPGIDSILLKSEEVGGEFRVGGYEKIYGDETETVHREHGTRIKVDPTEMFFSEREGTERQRIFESAEEGEEILVMFAGVGPFPVTIAENSEASRIVGVEKNPEAVAYARENVEMNDLGDRVEIIEGDVRDVCPDLGEFDRVLMPSPTNALEFLEEALGCVRDGGVLVVYSVQPRDDLYNGVIESVESEAKKQDMRVEVLEKRVTADFSPAKRKVAVEFRVKEA
ncbi:MAG: class I SAM-dependent methyltransferase family protein [Candidatus Nanosalina sp.]